MSPPTRRRDRSDLNLDVETLNRFRMISPPLSPTKTELVNTCNETSHGRNQLAHQVGRPSKKTNDSAVKKKTAGRLVSRTQRRCNSRQSVSGSRDRDDDDDDGNDSVGSNSDQESVSGSNGSKPAKRLLACPFYKHDSIRHISCVRLRLTRVRDVKQHLNRRHRRPLHCPVCGDTFGDSQRLDTHIRARSCVPPPDGFDIEGVTESQAIALARRVNRSLSEASQWFSIWEILFDSTPPETPYLSNHFEETLNMIYDYWHRYRINLASDLDISTLSDGSLSERVVTLSSQIIDSLLLRLRNSSQAIMDPAASNPTTVEPASHSTASFVPSTSVMPQCPTRFSAPLAPPRALPSLQQCPTQDQSTGISGGNIYTEASVANSQTPAVFSQSQTTQSASAHANSMLSQDLSPYASDTTQASPYNQLDGSCTTCTYHFLPSMDVSHMDSNEPLVSMEPELTHVGGWLSPVGMDCTSGPWIVHAPNVSILPQNEDTEALIYHQSDYDRSLFRY